MRTIPRAALVLENKNPKIPYVPTEASMTCKLGNEPFQTEIVEVEKGQRYEILLKVVSPPKLKTFKGDLLIKADSPTLPELKIGFAGIWGGATAPAEPAKAPEPAKTPAKPTGGDNGH